MIYRLADIKKAEEDLGSCLAKELQEGKNVLWLVSGGSNIEPSAQIMNNLPENLSKNLSIMLIHERFGEPGHANSNSIQFKKYGFNPKKANVIQALQSGANFEEAVRHYNNKTAEAFAENDVLIAQLGMGSDGHIAGILPHSPAAQKAQLVVGYEKEPFKILTLSLSALEMMDAIYVLAYGEHKQDALHKLHAVGLAAEDHPVQFLKQLPEVYFYNDHIGD